MVRHVAVVHLGCGRVVGSWSVVGGVVIRVWPLVGWLGGASAPRLVWGLGAVPSGGVVVVVGFGWWYLPFWCGIYFPSLLCVYIAIDGVLWWCHYAKVSFKSWCRAEWRCGVGVESVCFV